MENKISKIAMLILFGVAIVIACLFFFGGNVDDSAEYVEPVFTGLLMGLMYAYVGIAALLVIIAAIYNIALDYQKNPKSALKSVIGVGALVLIMVLSYLCASGEAVNVLGLEEEVSKGTLKMVDMELYTMYALLIIAALGVVFGGFAKKIK